MVVFEVVPLSSSCEVVGILRDGEEGEETRPRKAEETAGTWNDLKWMSQSTSSSMITAVSRVELRNLVHAT